MNNRQKKLPLKVGKSVFYYIRNTEGRRQKVNDGYLCKIIEKGVETIAVIKVDPLNLKRDDDNDGENKSKQPTEEAKNSSVGRNMLFNINDVSGPSSIPSSSSENVTENQLQRGKNVRQNNLRPTTNKRKRGDNEDDDCLEFSAPRKMSESAMLAKELKKIHEEEKAEKAKRSRDKLRILDDVRYFTDERQESNLKEMLDYLKESSRLREEKKEKIHQEKMEIVKSFYEKEGDKRELLHRKIMEKLKSNRETPEGQSMDLSHLQPLLSSVERLNESFDETFETCKELLLKDI